MTTDYILVEEEAALAQICARLGASQWLAVDTEFEREKTFYPELCLLQVANAQMTAVIDPLAIENLQALFDLLYKPTITKVFHAARQDLEIFYNLNGRIPEPLFDTQIAAPLLGYDEQIGYGNLVNKLLGVNLGKAHTRTDWKRRPLQAAQLQYAADDVIYLGQMYVLLLERLGQQNRLGWLDEDFAALADTRLYAPEPESVWKRNRGAKKLTGTKLCALQHLAAWRERRARAENRPRNWLIRDEVLVDLAQLQPRSLAELGRIKGVGDGVQKKYADDILAVLSKASQQEAQAQVEQTKRKPLNLNEESQLDALSAIVRRVAAANKLQPNILAPRRELEKLIQGDAEQSMVLKGWREHLVGEQLRACLDDKSALCRSDENLRYDNP